MNDLIKDNKDAILAALNFYLDYIYSVKESFFDEQGNRKSELSPDEGLENLISSLANNTDRYEKIRRKILDGDFNLSLAEKDYAGLAVFFWVRMAENQIRTLTAAKEKGRELYNAILKNSQVDLSQMIDFSSKV